MLGLLFGKLLIPEKRSLIFEVNYENPGYNNSCALHPKYASSKNAMKKNDYSIEIIRYSIPEDQRQKFETNYLSAGEFLMASPYCAGYEIIHGTDDPQHYIIRIHWTSVDDHLQKFRNSEHFRSFFLLVKPFYNNIDEMKHYKSLFSTL
jgi:quinol monooxygenase YgiN